MHRRAFGQALFVVGEVALLETLLHGRLLAAPAREPIDRWLRDLDAMCRDLRTGELEPVRWQDQIAALHARLPVDDLLALIDFDRVAAGFTYPDLGVVTRDPLLPRVAGLPAPLRFIARIFGMTRGRAIIPHGHRHMVSSHRVIGGAFHLRQYDREADDGEHLVIRQTRDELATRGSSSSISAARDNVHWLIATTPRAFTFDVIVAGLGGQPTEIDNIDIAAAERLAGDRLRVAKLDVATALAKYGKSDV